MKAQFTPMDIGVILIVLFIGLMFGWLLPTHLVERDISISLKISYTKNEADLALINLLRLNYSSDPSFTGYYLISTRDLNKEEFKNYFEANFRNLLNKTLNYKLKCFLLTNGSYVIDSYGNCNQFDYSVVYTIFKPGERTEKIILKYNKVE